MPPFTWALAAELLFKYGPSAVVFGQKIYENVAAGRADKLVTAADVAEMTRLANQTGADLYAREGIALPPPTAPSPDVPSTATPGGVIPTVTAPVTVVAPP